MAINKSIINFNKDTRPQIIYIKDYNNKFKYFHDIVKDLNEVDIYFFSREIDRNTMLAIEDIIKSGNTNSDNNSPYMKTKFYCCRKFQTEEFKDKLKEPHLKNIEIYNHPDKDFFHDRFILFKRKYYEDEIYLMGNGISSIKYQTSTIKAMCISKICGDNIKISIEHKQHLINDLDLIISQSIKVKLW